MHRYIILILILVISALETALAAEPDAAFWQSADRFFASVVQDGRVDYKRLSDERPAELEYLLQQIAAMNPQTLNDPLVAKAFWINAYNILVIEAVLKNYPLRSPQDVGGFFDRRKHPAAGEELTLNQLEKEKLLEPFSDARLHFVLVCAARGCPEIIQSAYHPETLEKQLEERIRTALSNPQHVEVDHTTRMIRISELFNWYRSDFTANGQSVIEFINSWRSTPLPSGYSIEYITYDWALNDLAASAAGPADPLAAASNLQAYTPSTLLRPGQIEVKLFNNLYTQKAFYNEQRERTAQNSRSSFFSAITNVLYGLTPNVNIGFDLWVKSVRNDSETSSAFALFQFDSDAGSRTAVSHIGPKVKLSPFSKWRSLSLQSTVLFPLASDLDGSDSNGSSPFLDFDDLQSFTQLFYDRSLSANTLLYVESAVFFRFGSEFEDFFTPLKAIVNYYPSQKTTVYLSSEFTPFWQDGSINAFYGQLGIGAKYQFHTNIEMETLYTNFVLGKSQGAGQTFNFGVRFIR